MKVLIIDDEQNICLSLKSIFEDEGYQAQYSLLCKPALNIIETFSPDVIFLDVQLQDGNGIELLEQIKQADKTIPVVMISGHSTIKEAVQAIKLGAFDFLEKPLSLPKVKVTVKKAMEFRSISEEYQRLLDNMQEQYKIIGNSKTVQELHEIIRKVARTNAKVLIRGESGSGKELIAYAIHALSPRHEEPFVRFNSAAIPNELVESELFGYEKGAFTGALKMKKGKLELANNGTLFLDEIADMNLSAQAKILRVIQDGEFERVGGSATIKIDARIVAATHKNLEDLVKQGLFREDLFYRLNVVPITSPSLRDRKEDIPLLVDYFSKAFSRELNSPEKSFTDKAIQQLQKWPFPGNIRELKNLIERIYILEDRNTIDCFNMLITKEPENDTSSFWTETKSFTDKKIEFEKRYLQNQLLIHDNNVSKTAVALGLQQSNLSRKLKELNLTFREDV